jgi:hypothetical protein
MHATSVVASKRGAMYRCYVQDPTGYILAAFYHLRSVYSQLQRFANSL